MIDPKINETINMLNRIGLRTIACCEGHEWNKYRAFIEFHESLKEEEIEDIVLEVNKRLPFTHNRLSRKGNKIIFFSKQYDDENIFEEINSYLKERLRCSQDKS